MNRLEQYLHECLEEYPNIRRLARDIYQRSLSFVPNKSIFAEKLTIRPGFFYGFHTSCPWSDDNRFLLTHKILSKQLSMPSIGEPVEIGHFVGNDYITYTPIAETRSWNWQKGAMLQWVGKSLHIIYNDNNGKQSFSRIIDVRGQTQRVIDQPISALSPDGKTALSYNFARLRKGMPGYEYADGQQTEKSFSPVGDGIFIINIESGNSKLLLSLKDITKYNQLKSTDESYHFFTHCLFSPNGSRFLFFHRWLTPSGVLKTRLFSSDCHGSDLHVLPTGDFVSHVSWSDENHIVAYADTMRQGRGYYLFRDKTDEYTKIGDGFFTSDGHPHISPDRRYMLTDTYPDRYRMQRLYLYDIEQAAGTELLRLKIPFRFRNELRCDFHPRWDRTGSYISIDSAHTGIRAHCTINIMRRTGNVD